MGNYSYDAGVYYSAGAALVRGRVPYRDFILLHPPGVTLAVAPAAWIGRVATDHTGFAVAALEFTLLGSASAVMVTVVARRLGAGRWAATAGGLFYATWFLSVRAEYVSRLEPLGNFLVLCGLAGYAGLGGKHPARSAVLCGALLGAAASVKIWYGVPLAVVLCLLVAQHRRRSSVQVAVGAVGAAVAICGPFFALAPTSMWRMVVSEQLARSQGNGLRALVTLQRLPSGLSRPAASLIDLVLVVTLGALVLAARRVPVVRVPLALLVASVGVLLAAPSFFVYYADYLTPAIALCVATGAAAVGAANFETHQRSARAYAVAGAVVIALLLAFPASALWYRPGTRPASLSSEQLASAVFDARCMMSDSPMALIELNALDDSLADGCPDWVDVSGRTYAPDMAVRGLDGRRLSRSANPRWQQAVRDYLLSGDAVILLRANDAGISPATQAAIESGEVLGRDRTHVIYSVGRENVRASGA